jgi:hypothetical protein
MSPARTGRARVAMPRPARSPRCPAGSCLAGYGQPDRCSQGLAQPAGDRPGLPRWAADGSCLRDQPLPLGVHEHVPLPLADDLAGDVRVW